MKLYDVGVNNKGTTLRLWVCDDDEKNMKEYRGNLMAVLEHIFSDLVLNVLRVHHTYLYLYSLVSLFLLSI